MTPLATAPNTATPTALPSERANMLVPVTTPRSSQPTLDCAAISVGVATRPIPRPMTKQVTATPSHRRRAAPSSASSAVPTTTSAEPISAVGRKPSRR